MGLPTIDSRPEKVINGIRSRWNAANLPLIYGISNTKWPTNTTGGSDSFTITGNSDYNGYAELTLSSAHSFVVKEWVKFTSTAYNGIFQIIAVTAANKIVIDTAYVFVAVMAGSGTKYYNNYTTLVRVYAGIKGTHEHGADKPVELIGTIEQRPDSDNISLVDVRDYVKNKINFDYDDTQASWPNDLNAWTDFYISFAERYDDVQSGEVVDFTSEYTIDTIDAVPVYLKAVHSALQFGNTYGGNMFEYVIFLNDAYDDGTAKFMTFFDRPKIIDYNNFDLSIIFDEMPYNQVLNVIVEEYDRSGNLLATNTEAVVNQDYGVYRISWDIEYNADTNYLNVYMDG